ncbi:MAG TPA: VWA domain-containing protein [Pyrinomonadaceae bacterium]|nr:VWA domain-containing protein [Pyrinomonadaceae bacterium]
MRRRLASFLTLVLVAASAHAQEPSAAKGPEAVRLNVVFADERGRPPAEVRREDVRVLAGGVEQPVTHFERVETPASYGLVVDNSGSMRSQMVHVVAAARVIVEKNGPADETFVVRFVASDQTQLLADFTSDKVVLAAALERMYVERGQTALVDALYLAAEHMEKKAAADAGGTSRRRSLVLISDGEDRSSFYKPEQLLALLKRARIQVFSIGLVADLERESGFITKSKREKATDLLKRLAAETGGRLYLAEKFDDLPLAVQHIVRDLHTHYVVGYTPPPAARPGAKVEVKVIERKGSPKLKAVTLPPTAGEPEGTDAKKRGGR